MNIITISGTPGSGKTTIAELLHKKLGIPYISSGMIFRETAEKYGMPLEDFSKYCEEHEEVDRELDEKQLEILRKGNIILESRLSGWLAYRNNIPAFKILVDADKMVRAERIVNREGGDIKQRLKELTMREESERRRYLKYYGIDLQDTSIYDLIIDSSDKTPDEIIDLILEHLGE
ncbi:MAG: cytidylate kinase [Thermoplasmata archaeon]|nr:MAG: cytidylate kinase [Thermoplasmata archaeon]HEC89971.1 cytidylate kinase [Thermoplasmatales archaeon]